MSIPAPSTQDDDSYLERSDTCRGWRLGGCYLDSSSICRQRWRWWGMARGPGWNRRLSYVHCCPGRYQFCVWGC